MKVIKNLATAIAVIIGLGIMGLSGQVEEKQNTPVEHVEKERIEIPALGSKYIPGGATDNDVQIYCMRRCND